MGSRTSIEWTQATWNPVTGCTKVSPGCRNCYAERLARRLQAMGNPSYTNGFEITVHEQMLQRPLEWKAARSIFVNSMSDLFHPSIEPTYLSRVFEIMERASHHRFHILTKRSERLLELNGKLPWPRNVWMGVSVEDSEHAFRIDHLRQTAAARKFLSIEPLLGPLPALNLSGIDWVIVGRIGSRRQAHVRRMGDPNSRPVH